MSLPIILLLAGYARGSGQHILHLKDGKGLEVQAQGVSRVTAGVNVIYMLDKSVQVDSSRQGLSLRANMVVAKTVADANAKKGELLSTATATGQVVFDKVVATARGRQTTHITGSKADYADGTVESTVKLAGPVSIHSLDTGGSQNLTAAGSSGIAYLERSDRSASNSGLKRAILQGSVHVDVDRRQTAKQKALSLRALADQGLVENIGDRQRITLTGHVQIQGPGSSTSTGINKAVITIEKDGTMNLKAEAA